MVEVLLRLKTSVRSGHKEERVYERNLVSSVPDPEDL
jgi:hypothetical protein